MYIAIYVSVIILVAGLLVCFFVVKDRKEKKKFKEMKEKELTTNVDPSPQEFVNEQVEENVLENKTENIDSNMEELEEFSLDDDEGKTTGIPTFKATSSNERDNKAKRLFDKDFFESLDEEDEDLLLDEKFEDYEEYFDDEDKLDSESSANIEDDFMESLDDFNLEDKNLEDNNEIEEAVDNLPPKLKNIFFSDVLGRKNMDDDENGSDKNDKKED